MELSDTIHTEPAACPYCSGVSDALSGVGHGCMPEAGDISLCIYCGEWMVFESIRPLRLRKPTTDEHIDIGLLREFREAREAWVRCKERGKI